MRRCGASGEGLESRRRMHQSRLPLVYAELNRQIAAGGAPKVVVAGPRTPPSLCARDSYEPRSFFSTLTIEVTHRDGSADHRYRSYRQKRDKA